MVRRVRATIPEGLRGRPFQLRGVGVGKGSVVTVVQDNIDSVLIQRTGTGNEMSVTEVRPDFESWRSIEAEKWLGFDSQGAQRKVFPILAHATVSGDGRWAYLAVKYMAVGNLFTFASRIAVWDVDGARLSGFMPGILDGEVSAMELAPDGKTLLLGLGQSIRQEVESPRRTSLAAYRVADGKRLWSRDYSAQGSLVNIAVAPDGNQLAAIAGGLLATVEMASGAERQRFAGAEKQLKAVAFSDDGKVLAAGGHDSRFLAWDAGTGQSIARLAGHTGEIHSIKFIPGGDWVLSAGSDHQVKLWDLKKNDELLTFASFAGGEVDWVTLTPEGYFAASPGGADLVGFHIGNRLYQLNQFYDLFYRPDLVRRRLAGEAIDGLAPERILQAIDFPPPDVWVTMENAPATADSVTMRLSVRSAGGGIGEVRVFHNGKLVRSDGFIRPAEQQTVNLAEQTPALVTRGLAATSRQSRPAGETGRKGNVFEEVIRLPPVTGDNEIAVTAFNRNNTVQSRFVTTSFVSGRRMADPRVFLVAIGVNEFKSGGRIALKYAAKDASDIAAFLKSHAGQVNLGALADSVVLLDRQATKAAIAAAFDTLAHKIGPQDALVVFVATHGLFDAEGYVFLTHDFDGTVRPENAIGAAEIIEYLKRISAQRQLVILDTCHAGGMNNALDGLYDARMTILARNAGLHVIASAGSLEEAIDGFEQNGLFTHVLLQGLQSSAADLNVDGRISVFELGDYGRQAADGLARSVGHSQTPLILRHGRDYPVYQVRP